ncbi:SIS domain-containing protein [candidate division WOR-3 bacterium]|nr:SIS domain-containing protein [candidate division WOR-3 bacterium]
MKRDVEESLNIKRLLLSECIDDIEEAAEILIEAVGEDKRIFLCGNGGSASDCQHIASEFVGRIRKKSISVPAVALASNVSTLTALSNDFGYENVFSKQIEVYASTGDVLIAISTSGNSVNVINAVKSAKERDVRVIVMTGKGGTMLSDMADLSIMVPSDDTPRIQEAHILIGHILASILEKAVSR